MTSSFRVQPAGFSRPLHEKKSPAKHAHISCAADDADADERERLQKLGEEAANEARRLDASSAGDDLLNEFNRRLEREGGAAQFRLRTDAQQVAENVQGSANKVKEAGRGLADSANSAVSQLPPNLLPFL